MTPSALRSYLKEHQQASLADLCVHFRSTPDAIQAAMQTWVRKGKAQVSTAESGCGKSCCQCKIETVTIYRWIEDSTDTSVPQAQIWLQQKTMEA